MRAQTAVLIPTRDRPEKLGELLADWRSTTARPIVLVDDDQIEMYDDLLTHPVKRVRCSADIVASVQPRARLVAKLNGACRLLGHRYKYVGFMGDDHRPRTDGWDERLTESIEAEPKSTGIAYGDDLHQGQALPTAVMMSVNIVRALGYMVPPVLQHYYCVAPATRVLTADLRWVEAGKISEGDAVMGFEEYPRPGAGRSARRRRWQQATVTRAERIIRPCYDLTFTDGATLRCSAEHQWLVGGDRGRRWRTTESLWKDAQIVKPLDTWEEATTWEAGYLAAAFDGEGCLIQRDATADANGRGLYAVRLDYAQKPNAMFDQVEAILASEGYAFTRGNGGGAGVKIITVSRREEVFRLLGSVRPRRLLAKLDPDRFGAMSQRTVGLVSKRSIGDHEVAAISTSTRTFIAEGFASHNCDDFWRDLGLGVGCLTYRPDVVIEHMHPDAEKAERDDLYDETQPLIHPDTAAWAAWKSEGSLDAAVARIRRIRERP